jgi:predicted molibdopterin-dependent oxidoreductase YjgC
MVILGEDVLQTDAGLDEVKAALKSLKFLVVQELFLTDTAKLADVVLPGASFLEKDGTFTNGERRVQRVKKVVEPPGEARADWEILLDLMQACGIKQPFKNPAEIFEEISRVSPAFAGISYARLELGSLQWPVSGLDHPGTAILHTQPSFTPKLHQVEWLPSPAFEGRGLTLVTGRRLEHYNCGSMTRRGAPKDLVEADEVELHPKDAARLGIEDGSSVVVASERGEASGLARLSSRVREGECFMTFHFPESRTNVVTGGVEDRWTDCPEYKLTRVFVRPGVIL